MPSDRSMTTATRPHRSTPRRPSPSGGPAARGGAANPGPARPRRPTCCCPGSVRSARRGHVGLGGLADPNRSRPARSAVRTSSRAGWPPGDSASLLLGIRWGAQGCPDRVVGRARGRRRGFTVSDQHGHRPTPPRPESSPPDQSTGSPGSGILRSRRWDHQVAHPRTPAHDPLRIRATGLDQLLESSNIRPRPTRPVRGCAPPRGDRTSIRTRVGCGSCVFRAGAPAEPSDDPPRRGGQHLTGLASATVAALCSHIPVPKREDSSTITRRCDQRSSRGAGSGHDRDQTRDIRLWTSSPSCKRRWARAP